MLANWLLGRRRRCWLAGRPASCSRGEGGGGGGGGELAQNNTDEEDGENGALVAALPTVAPRSPLGRQVSAGRPARARRRREFAS